MQEDYGIGVWAGSRHGVGVNVFLTEIRESLMVEFVSMDVAVEVHCGAPNSTLRELTLK